MVVDDVQTLKLLIKSPAGLLFEQAGLESVQMVLRDGKIGIRIGHAPMIAEVGDGEAVLNNSGSMIKMPIHGGIAVVKDDLITIYTHSIDPDLAILETGIEESEDEFDALYDAIIAKLIPGEVKAEGQNDT